MSTGRLARVVAGGALMGFLAMGCASSHSQMIGFAPSTMHDTRRGDQLLEDLNASIPFRVAAGDFVTNPGFFGPNCWICLADPVQSDKLIAFLQNSPAWRILSIGEIDPANRSLFGLSAIAGSTCSGQGLESLQGNELAHR